MGSEFVYDSGLQPRLQLITNYLALVDCPFGCISTFVLYLCRICVAVFEQHFCCATATTATTKQQQQQHSALHLHKLIDWPEQMLGSGCGSVSVACRQSVRECVCRGCRQFCALNTCALMNSRPFREFKTRLQLDRRSPTCHSTNESTRERAKERTSERANELEYLVLRNSVCSASKCQLPNRNCT